jgi:hypothetical protein
MKCILQFFLAHVSNEHLFGRVFLFEVHKHPSSDLPVRAGADTNRPGYRDERVQRNRVVVKAEDESVRQNIGRVT